MSNLVETVSITLFQQQLFSELKKQDDPRMSGNGQIFDEYPSANVRERGYYERFMRGEDMERSSNGSGSKNIKLGIK